MDTGPIALVVLSYNPDARLIELLQPLFARWDGPIIVVDDGSGPESARVFSLCRDLGATVVRHKRNRGKGEAPEDRLCLCHDLDAEARGGRLRRRRLPSPAQRCSRGRPCA